MGIIASCNLLPNTVVWVRNINFEIDQKANGGKPFVCHVVVPYNDELKELIVSMDSKAYFNKIAKLKKENKDFIEILEFDMIPGKNQINKPIKLKSYAKAKGAYLFAKYEIPGKFMEDIGGTPLATIRCLSHKIELVDKTE
jgi:hypothetical protein